MVLDLVVVPFHYLIEVLLIQLVDYAVVVEIYVLKVPFDRHRDSFQTLFVSLNAAG